MKKYEEPAVKVVCFKTAEAMTFDEDVESPLSKMYDYDAGVEYW